MCVVDAVIKCRHRSLKAELWRRQRLRVLCLFRSCVCPCLAPAELVTDSVNNCVQGSLGVHWVTGGYRQDNLRGVENVIHALTPDLLLCLCPLTYVRADCRAAVVSTG